MLMYDIRVDNGTCVKLGEFRGLEASRGLRTNDSVE